MILFLTCFSWEAYAQSQIVGLESRSHSLLRQVLEEEVVDHEALRFHFEAIVSGLEKGDENAKAFDRWIEFSVKKDISQEADILRMKMGAAEDRPKNALQLLEVREGVCRVFCLCFVCCMRAIRILARHVVAFWKYSGGGRNFAAEY
ncbi:MAG: transglutaminase domain-containing protein [Verrucomicrobiota bacterium JB023]|nr:transglutaminase domain-containing protein [Verrucomicrobiota bacterium JB023]